MLKRRWAAYVGSAGLMAVGAGAVSAQTAATVPAPGYPTKPLRIITSGVGGGNDFMSRMIAQGIAGSLGQPVVVENRPNTIIIAETVAQAPSDGYTLLFGSSSLWVLPLMQKVPYDAVKDFAPIIMVDRAPNILVVHPSLPVTSVKELIALAKARPGDLNYSFGTLGSSAQLAAELIKSMAGITMVGISYKGSAPQLNAVIAGEVQLTFASATSSVTQHLKSGRLRALAVTTLEPSVLLPGMTTVAAAGLPGYEAASIDGVWARSGTPGAIISRLNQEIERFLNQAGVKEKFQSSGVEMAGGTPEQFAAAIKADAARMGRVIKDAGIRAD